jgi:hypothetical protein
MISDAHHQPEDVNAPSKRHANSRETLAVGLIACRHMYNIDVSVTLFYHRVIREKTNGQKGFKIVNLTIPRPGMNVNYIREKKTRRNFFFFLFLFELSLLNLYDPQVKCLRDYGTFPSICIVGFSAPRTKTIRNLTKQKIKISPFFLLKYFISRKLHRKDKKKIENNRD